jgi:branched-chain amino acid transport system substrate-binding protein
MGGDGWVGITTDTAASEGAIVGAPFTAADPRPKVQEFRAAFRKAHGRDPESNAAQGYDATMTVAQAIQEAGADRKAIRDWLAALNTGKAVDGVTGRIAFQKSGDLEGRGMVMTRVRAGTLIVESGS